MVRPTYWETAILFQKELEMWKGGRQLAHLDRDPSALYKTVPLAYLTQLIEKSNMERRDKAHKNGGWRMDS